MVQIGGRAGRINPLICGNNLDWSNTVQGGTDPGGLTLRPAVLDLTRRLAPTALRFPGGSNADLYHWQGGIGPLSGRAMGITTQGEERMTFGTDEFLDLCADLGAEPIIQINVARGTPDEAAAWVRHCNRTRRGPRVQWWEMGNEPYLEPVGSNPPQQPEAYAARADACMKAMRAVDPGIRCGIPLRSDVIGGKDIAVYPGFDRRLLGALRQPFDFVCLHNAYYPLVPQKGESRAALYLATMAAVETFRADMVAVTDLLASVRPGWEPRFAITEWNTIYSVDILRWGIPAVFLSRTDRHIASLASALYAADLLADIAGRESVAMANFWALNGNWWFGAIGFEDEPRPVFPVLERWRGLAGRDRLAVSVACPVLSTPAAGIVASTGALPQLAAFAARDPASGEVTVQLINRHPDQGLQVLVSGTGVAPAAKTRLRCLSGDDPFDRAPRLTELATTPDGQALVLTLPPHSAGWLDVAG
jgi:alpha-N-arabinofuranosidase